MSSASLPHPADPADQQAEDAHYYRRVLHELIDMGVDLARAMHRQGTAQAESADPGDGDPAAATTVLGTTVAFDRISRAIRRTVALARKVAEPVPARAAAEQHRAAARRRIIREVEDAIQREVRSEDEAEALYAELCERLDGPEIEDEIGGRPVAEVVADICRDLGLLTLLGNHPWKRRTPRDIEALCARAARPPARAGQPRTAPSPPGPSPGTARTPPYPREFGIELMHKLLAHGPPIRGP